MITRRDFVRTAIAAALVPSWLSRPVAAARRVIDLTPFCLHKDEWFPKYNLDAPFIQTDGSDTIYRYGTDGRVCIRAPAADSERDTGSEFRRPPAHKLPYWLHDQSTGWHPWPRSDYLLASYSECPACNGNGVTVVDGRCKECSEFGDPFCRDCMGTGNLGPRCQACGGCGEGVFPAVQRVGSLFVRSKYDRKVRTLGEVEYCDVGKLGHPVLLRGDGWEGLLMTMDERETNGRLRCNQ